MARAKRAGVIVEVVVSGSAMLGSCSLRCWEGEKVGRSLMFNVVMAERFRGLD